jgi:hypothetical protein
VCNKIEKIPVGGSSPGSQETVLKWKFRSYKFRDQLQQQQKSKLWNKDGRR